MPGKHTAESGLTPREAQIAARVAAGETVSGALRAVGANRTSESYRKRLHPGGDMHAAMMAAWRRQGISLARVARRHREALDATETRIHTHRGEVIERTDLVAHATRLQAVELAYRVAGVLTPERQNDDRDQIIAVQINLSAPEPRNGNGNGNGNGGNGHGPSGTDPLAGLSALGIAIHPTGGHGGGA